MNLKKWCLGAYAVTAMATAQAEWLRVIPVEKLDFQLIPMVLDEKDIPPQDRAKYRPMELTLDEPKASEAADERMFYVSQKVYLTQEDVADTSVSADEMGGFAVNLVLTKRGAEKFTAFTREFLGQQTLILDKQKGIYYTDPIIRDVIKGGRVQIGGGIASQKQAQQIAARVREHIEFRGVSDSPAKGFEAITLKSLPVQAETSVTIWADADKTIQAQDISRVWVVKRKLEVDEELQMLSQNLGIEHHDMYVFYLQMNPNVQKKWVEHQSAALLTKEKRLVRFIPYHGGNVVSLAYASGEEGKAAFLQKITK